MSDRHYGYGVKRYLARVDGHEVAVEFDKRRVVLNQARLHVDGQEVDRANIFYGDKTLSTTTSAGVEVEVIVDSGMMGELTRAQVRTERGGAWTDLQEDVDRSV